MSDEALYDEAGDFPPPGGFPDRRHDTRRDDDKVAQELEVGLLRFFFHRGRLMSLVAGATFLFTSLGFRILGPSADLKALDQKFTAKDSIMSVRVSRIEDGQSQIRAELQSIAESMRFLTYMACQATDKDRRPNTCYVVAKEIQ